MSNSTDNTPANSPPADNPNQNGETARPKRRGLRFGLLELLLLMAFIAAWLPVIIARRRIPDLQTEIQTMRYATMELLVTDEQQLNARTLPSIWHNISGWKVFVPKSGDFELRLATEGINSVSEPQDYKSVPLLDGEHMVHLKVTSDAEGHHTEVYVDEDLVLQQHHDSDWVKSSGSTSSSGVSNESTVYPVTAPLTLKDQSYSLQHPLRKYQTLEVPEEYDHKGNRLWIAARSSPPAPPPTFALPKNKYSDNPVGHRQGMKVSRSNILERVGLICIQPSLDSARGDQRRHNYFPLAVSVRPVLDDNSTPQIPEKEVNADNPSLIGLPLSFRDTIDPPSKYDDYAVHVLVTEKSISDDGKEMRLFAHFPPFASGAQLIVEIRFDAAHPDRVAFLPRAAPNSVPIQSCQFVTRFDSKFLWREIELLQESVSGSPSESPKPLSTPLSQIYLESDFAKLTTSIPSNSNPLPWQNVPLNRLPRIDSADSNSVSTKLSLLTDVADSSKLTFPMGLGREWKYDGVANRQVWLLPTAEAADKSKPEIQVDIRATPVYPGTSLSIPGGPSVGNVRITVPMPATQPVWLEIVAEPPTQKI